MHISEQSKNEPKSSILPYGGDLAALLAKNTFWLLLDRAVLSIGTAVAGLLLIRSLGPNKYGIYVLAISIGTLVAALTDLGMRLFFVRSVAATPKKMNSYFSTGLFIKLIQLLLTVMLSSLVIIHLPQGMTMKAALIAGVAFGVFLNVADLTASFFLGSMRPKLILVGRFVSRIGTIMIITFTIAFKLSVPLLIGFLCLLQILVIILRIMQLKMIYKIKISLPIRTDIFSTIQSSLSFYIYSLTAIAYGQVGLITLGFVTGRESCGIYGAAFALVGLFPSLVYAGIDALMPIMANLYENGRWQEIISLRTRIFETILLFSAPVAITIAFFPTEITSIFGKQFTDTSVPVVLKLMAIHACLGPIEGLFGGAFLTATNQLLNRAKQMLFANVVLIVLSSLLGSLWGAKGAAIALISADIVLLIGYARACRVIGFPIKLSNSSISISIGALLTVIVAILLSDRINHVLNFIILVSIYGGFLLLTCRPLLMRTRKVFFSVLFPHSAPI